MLCSFTLELDTNASQRTFPAAPSRAERPSLEQIYKFTVTETISGMGVTCGWGFGVIDATENVIKDYWVIIWYIFCQKSIENC